MLSSENYFQFEISPVFLTGLVETKCITMEHQGAMNLKLLIRILILSGGALEGWVGWRSGSTLLSQHWPHELRCRPSHFALGNRV